MKQIKLSPPFLHIAGKPLWEQRIYHFLEEWYNADDFVLVQTSGSTGAPKTLRVSKAMMRRSAQKTLQYFSLQANDKMLLCLSADYIAGKMMLIRAIVGKLQLWAVEPNSTPFKNLPFAVDFASTVPLQAFEMLRQNVSFNKVQNILIGGGAISPALEEKLQTCQSQVFESYGMTETVSHIALRRVNTNKRETGFVPLSGVSITIDERECAVIDCPDLLTEKITTNDRVKMLQDGSFRILGRVDNVINSGGIKIQPEEVERKIADFFTLPFAVSAVTDEKLGEKLVLATEESVSPEKLSEINSRLLSYEKLHKIFVLKLPFTATQKINRKELLILLRCF